MKNLIKQSPIYIKLSKLYERHEKLLIPGALVVGVIIDFVTFRSIGITSTFALLGAYFILAGAAIAIMHYHGVRLVQSRAMWYSRLAAPLVIQITFGAMLSASLVFYWFSASLSISWPILALVAILIASNELLRKYYLQLPVQIGVYYFATFSICTLIIPYIFNSIAAGVFLLGGAISLAIGIGYINLLLRALERLKNQKKKMTWIMVSVFVAMNALYFLNIIPPIPLSLREAGAYHNIEASGGTYKLLGEKYNFFEKLIPGQQIHILEGDSVYVFSAIFAPTDLDTTIVHHWEAYDEETNKWVTEDELSFYLTGGREDGFRGYSLKSAVYEGKWRVSVETKRGQTLGRIRFDIKYVEELPELSITSE